MNEDLTFDQYKILRTMNTIKMGYTCDSPRTGEIGLDNLEDRGLVRGMNSHPGYAPGESPRRDYILTDEGREVFEAFVDPRYEQAWDDWQNWLKNI